MLEGKDVFMEFGGNIVPVLQSGDQPKLGFKAFRENRLAFTIRLRDQVKQTFYLICYLVSYNCANCICKTRTTTQLDVLFS